MALASNASDVRDRAKALDDGEAMGLSKWVRRLVVEKVRATPAYC